MVVDQEFQVTLSVDGGPEVVVTVTSWSEDLAVEEAQSKLIRETGIDPLAVLFGDVELELRGVQSKERS